MKNQPLKEFVRPLALNPDDKLVRLGFQADGGYVINQKAITSVDVCYTYGVGRDVSFEIDLVKQNPNAKVHFYDHTMDFVPPCPNMFFHKEGLGGFKQEWGGFRKDGPVDTFFNHVQINGDTEKNILLKMDAERGEYDFLATATEENFSNLKIHAMIVEFHYVHQYYDKFLSYVEKIKKNFNIVHIHGNTIDGSCGLEGFDFPITPEITFLNKKIYPLTNPLYVSYPIEGLDFKNRPHNPIVYIDFLK